MSAPDDHPLAGVVAGGASASPAAPVSRPSPQPRAASPSPAASAPADDDSDAEHEAELRRSTDPFIKSASNLATATHVPAPRPRSDAPARAAAFWAALSTPSGLIDESVVRKYVFDYGSPEQPAGCRSLLWKLLLGYLPWDRNQWAASLKRNRATYATFVEELTANPFANMEDDAAGPPLQPSSSAKKPNASSTATATSSSKPGSSPSSSSIKTNLRMVRLSPSSDDPLSSSHTSSWSAYYKDNSIREEIEKDVRRTYSTFHFFQERVRPQETTPEEVRRANQEERERLARETQRMEQRAAERAARTNEAMAALGVSSSRPVQRTNLFSDDADTPFPSSRFSSSASALSPPVASSTTGSSANLFDEFAQRQSEAAAKEAAAAASKSPVPAAAASGADGGSSSTTSALSKNDENHHDVIKRILFVYAKLNPGIRYVQGMNEILAPVYYVFAHNGSDLRRGGPLGPLSAGSESDDPVYLACRGLFDVETAEADAFFCFTNIMSHMRDRFCKTLDTSSTGVLNVIANVNSLLQRVDYQLWEHLQAISVDPRFYSFRWLTLILSQEFELPDVLRLWDSLFAAEPEVSSVELAAAREANSAAAGGAGGRKGSAASASPSSPDEGLNKKLIVEFLNDCCCAMLCLIRRALLEADFSGALKLLQSAGQGLDVQRVLFKAQEIRKIRRAGGGYVPPIAQKPSPPPLNPKELAVPFTVPLPRPGEEGYPAGSGSGAAGTKKPLNVALLDALRGAMPSLPSSAKSKQARVQSQGLTMMREGIAPAPEMPPPTSSASAAPNATPAPSSASPVAGDDASLAASASAAAASLGALVLQGVHAAADVGLHAVESAVHSGAALAAAAGVSTPNKDVGLVDAQEHAAAVEAAAESYVHVPASQSQDDAGAEASKL